MSEMETLEREIASTAAYLTKLRRQRRDMEIAAGKNARANSPRVQAIKRAYVANQISLHDLAREFGTSRGFIQNLVIEFNWPRRSPPKCHGQRLRRQQEGA